MIRRMTTGDVKRVRAISERTFQEGFLKSDLLEAIFDPTMTCLVAENVKGVRVGYAIFSEFQTVFHLVEVAIDGKYLRRGYGRQLIQHVIRRLSADGRRRIRVVVGEDNVVAQLFFKSLGFKWVNSIEKDYLMTYTHKSPVETTT